jgi:hypothetical protein
MAASNTAMDRDGGEPVGDFYVHLLQGEHVVASEMTSSTKLLTNNGGKIATVIHFYDGS